MCMSSLDGSSSLTLLFCLSLNLFFKRRCTKFARNEAYCCLFPLMRISTIKMKEKLQNRKQIKGIIKTRYRDKRPNCPQNHIERACVMADKMKTLSRLC